MSAVLTLDSETVVTDICMLLVVIGRRASQPKAVVKNIDADDSADDQGDDDDRSVCRFLTSVATIKSPRQLRLYRGLFATDQPLI